MKNEIETRFKTVDNVDNATEETGFVRIPVPSTKEGTGKVEPVIIKIPKNATSVPPQVTGSSEPQIWMPCLPSSLSAQTLFNLALTVEAPDPARHILGLGYENRLKRECEVLIPHPIPSYYRMGIGKALRFRRNNPGYFMCSAIDVVLTYYLNNYYPEDNDVFQ